MVRNKWNFATSEFKVHICIKTSAPTADMDALSLDQMLPEYQQSKQEVEHEIEELHRGDSSLPEDLDTHNSSTDTYSNELSNNDTVPVSDILSEPDPGIAGKAEGNRPASMDSTSSTSSSVESYKQPSSSGSTSLYQAGFTAPTITYERDNDNQKLIAVIGREFDCPPDISVSLQKLTSKQPNSSVPVAKFVPFTVKRKMLLRGSFDNRELRKHDLICMCYNASEARLLLTGVDGFYSSLLKYVEAYLGPNKVAFLISNYSAPHNIPDSNKSTSSLIFPSLRTRLYHQEPLRAYLDGDHVMSWSDEPNELQAKRLVELASLEFNPQSILGNNCCLL